MKKRKTFLGLALLLAALVGGVGFGHRYAKSHRARDPGTRESPALPHADHESEETAVGPENVHGSGSGSGSDSGADAAMRRRGEVVKIPGEWPESTRLTMTRLVRETRRLLAQIEKDEARKDWSEAYKGYESIVFMIDTALFDAEDLLARNGIDAKSIYARALECERRVGETYIADTLRRREDEQLERR
jgi:hypothetical protein